MNVIDLNADLGESPERWESGEDLALLDLVTSANVCCGAYAGDDDLIRRTCEAAVARDVAIGAQVGYADRENFGRVFLDIESETLTAQVFDQIVHLQNLAASVGARVTYVKPHGALYNRIVHDVRQAHAVVEAAANARLPLVGLPHATSLKLARARGMRVIHEGFADRAYLPDGSLMPRTQPGAVFALPAEAAEQAIRLASSVDSICLHSDSPGAFDMADAVLNALTTAGFEVRHL